MKRHFQYNWYKYLAVILLPILLWCFLFNLLSKPQSREQVRILFVGESLDVASLQKDLQSALPTLSAQPLKEITVTQAVPGALSFHEFLISQSFRYDILILSEAWMQESIGQRFLSPLSINPGNFEIYQETVEGKPIAYGYIIDPEAHFFSYCQSTDHGYLFFSPELDEIYVPIMKAAQYLLEVEP